jgi:hypothetical protein
VGLAVALTGICVDMTVAITFAVGDAAGLAAPGVRGGRIGVGVRVAVAAGAAETAPPSML